jgi:hypothetical protein
MAAAIYSSFKDLGQRTNFFLDFFSWKKDEQQEKSAWFQPKRRTGRGKSTATAKRDGFDGRSRHGQQGRLGKRTSLGRQLLLLEQKRKGRTDLKPGI